MMTWRGRKQLLVIGLLAILPTLIIIWLVYKALPGPSCFDNKQNQQETEVDCGGSCGTCELKHPKDIAVFWSKAAQSKTKTYDVVAFIKNQNEVLSSGQVRYEFTLYDDLGQIARKEGTTFLLPQERTYIVESGLKTNRAPSRVQFKILDVKWQPYQLNFIPDLIAEKREYSITQDLAGRPRSTVDANIFNRSLYGYRDVEVDFILFDAEQNLLGVSHVQTENIASQQSRPVRAIWPQELGDVEVSSIQVNARVNVFDTSVLIKPL